MSGHGKGENKWSFYLAVATGLEEDEEGSLMAVDAVFGDGL